MLVENINSKYLICTENFGPFKQGEKFYCTSMTKSHFYVLSEASILGVDKFKIHIEHIAKFIIMS